jgi:hypothetical protein
MNSACAVILLIECALVLDKGALPTILPQYITVHEVTSMLHRMFPAYMHACRCVIGSSPDQTLLPARISILSSIQNAQNKSNIALVKVAKQFRKKFCECTGCKSIGDKTLPVSNAKAVLNVPASSRAAEGRSQQGGIVHNALQELEQRLAMTESDTSTVENCIKVMQNSQNTENTDVAGSRKAKHFPLSYLLIFVVVTYGWKYYGEYVSK